MKVVGSPSFGSLPRRLVLRCSLCPGDIVMLTAAVRDLHRTHPGQFLTDVRTSSPELWENNPYLTALDETEPGVEVIDCHYPLIHQSNQNPLHFIHGFIDFLGRRLGVRFQPTVARGDVHLSAAEKALRSPIKELIGREVPYWIIVAGGKHDYTIKWWELSRYQGVVDHFRDHTLFVQVGEDGHHHPPLRGVLDLRGRTNLRQLITLVHHAQGVLCPVTSLMHLAAAVETRPGAAGLRPCVVVAGGREPPTWEAYPGHQFVHTVGTLACCARGGCWRARTLPMGDGDEKDEPKELCLDVVNELPHCMHLITAEDVIRRMQLYFAAGSLRRLNDGEARSARLALRRQALVANSSSSAPKVGRRRNSRPPPAVTICALTYGDYPHLIRRCLESVRTFCPCTSFRLVVGANEPSARTLRYLLKLRSEGFIDRLHLSPVNLNKCPMMRRMFSGGIDTEYVLWMDDDFHVASRTALSRRLALARRSSPSVVAWGHKFFLSHEDEFHCGFDVRSWIRASRWYQGKPLPSWEAITSGHPGEHKGVQTKSDGRWFFLTGGSWIARTEALRALDWPDSRLIMEAEDVLMSEAIRQQGWEIEDIGPLGIARSQTPSRRETAASTAEHPMTTPAF